MEFLNALKWRAAVKKFDPNRRVSDADFAMIKEAIQLSPSSIGLQPYEVMVIEGVEMRSALQPLCWGQAQIVESDRLLLFCHMLSLPDEYVVTCGEQHSQARGGDPAMVEQVKMVVANLIGSRSAEQVAAWANAEVHIATGVAMSACAALGIDACPIGGFQAEDVSEYLGLKARNLGPSLFLPIGYRSAKDMYCQLPKVRKPMDSLFIEPTQKG